MTCPSSAAFRPTETLNDAALVISDSFLTIGELRALLRAAVKQLDIPAGEGEENT